jgi:hypothetical protein
MTAAFDCLRQHHGSRTPTHVITNDPAILKHIERTQELQYDNLHIHVVKYERDIANVFVDILDKLD